MARPPRPLIPGAVYHVMARGNERRPIYRDDRDRLRFLDLLAATSTSHEMPVLAYCLMPNHYHVLVSTTQPNLSSAMRYVNGVYAQWFNVRHERVGHLFQGRFGARVVQEEEYWLAVLRYIVRNPCRAGLCATPSDWRWSSHRAMLGLDRPTAVRPDEVLDRIGPDRPRAARAYVDLTEFDEEPEGLPRRSVHQLVDGDAEFVDGVVDAILPSYEHPRTMRQPLLPALSEVFAGRAEEDGIETASSLGYSLRQIGAFLGVHASTVSRRRRQRGATRDGVGAVENATIAT